MKSFPKQDWLLRYGGALLAVGVGYLIRVALMSLTGGHLPTYITFYPAVMAVALVAGFGPGLVATAATLLVVDFLVLDPKYSLKIESPADAVSLAIFAGMGLFMCVVAERYRRAQQRNQAQLQALVAARTAELDQSNQQLKQEVEEHRQAEEALGQQREWLRVTLNSLGDAVLATDTAGRITFLNPVAARLTGYESHEARGKAAREVFRIINEQTRAPAEDIVDRVLREGQVVALANHTALVARDGSEVPIEDSAAPIKDTHGTVSGVVLVFHDVAQKRHAQDALARLAAVVESSEDAILSRDLDGNIKTWNAGATRLFGYQPAEIIGQPITMLLPPDRQEEESRIMARLRAGERLDHYETVRVGKDGHRFDVSVSVSPLRNAAGEITGASKIIRDITERKRAEQRADLLAETAGELLSADTPQSVVDQLCRRVLKFLNCELFFNFLVDDEQHRLRLNACAGIPRTDMLGIQWLDFGVAVCGCVDRDACRIVAEDVQHTPDPRTELVRSYGVQAYACHPLLVQGRVVGALSFGARNRAQFSDEDLSLMKAVADQVAIAMERQQTQAALKKANEELERRVAARTAALHAAERYARSLLEASLDPLVTINREGKITDVNLATELVSGVRREALVGSSFSSYFTEPRQAEAGYQQVLKQGAVSDYPLTIRHVSGYKTDVLYNAAVYRNEAGEVQGVFAAARDITERKQAERRREFTNALLSLFAQKSSAGDYLNSVVEAIRQWTGCQALGIRLLNEHEEIPYESSIGFEPGFLELEQRLSLKRDQCFCIRAVSGAFEDSDRSLLTSGGSFRSDDAIAFIKALPPETLARYRGNCMKFGFASVAIIPIRYREEVVGVIHLADRRPGQFPPPSIEFIEAMTPLIGEAVHRFQTEAELAKHRDHLEELVKQRTSELSAANERLHSEIAERQRAQEALQQTTEDLRRSNRDLEQFAYVASHDLQEPLRAVGGYVKLIQRRFPENVDPKAKEFIAGAAEGATRMERLITDLLAFSRVGTRGGDFVSADFGALLDDALQNLQFTIKSANVQITRDPLPTLVADPTQIMQVFQNLIGNAIKFRGEHPPRIHIGARQEAQQWVFSVRDNGIGIEPQYFERIFHIFQRLHTRKAYPGTGIGLAICKKIVERHGGAIWLESQLDQGTTFFFSLPAGPAGKGQTT